MSSKKTKLTFSSSDDELYQTKKRYFQTKKTGCEIMGEEKADSQIRHQEIENQHVFNVETDETSQPHQNQPGQQIDFCLDLSDQLLNTSLDDSVTTKIDKKLYLNFYNLIISFIFSNKKFVREFECDIR